MEPEKAKCEICKQKNIDKNMKVSKDNKNGARNADNGTNNMRTPVRNVEYGR